MSPTKRGQRALDVVAGERHRTLVEDLAGGVERARRDAEHDATPVGLARLGEVAQQPGAATEADEQHTGGVGIERARVTDPSLPVDLAQLGHDVVRRAARRLVDDDQAVAHRTLQGSEASRMFATTVGMSRVDSNPAAKRWPPPPLSAAMTRTSTSPSERRLTRTDPSASSLSDAGDLGLGRPPDDVDEALDLLERDAVCA